MAKKTKEIELKDGMDIFHRVEKPGNRNSNQKQEGQELLLQFLR